jgi:hypothetical protein
MPDPKIIEAEQIILRDAAGNIRIVLDALSSAGPSVQLHSDSGKMAVELRAYPDSKGVVLVLRAPHRHLIARLDENGSRISLTDGEGKHSIEISAPLETGSGRVEVFSDGRTIAALPDKAPIQPSQTTTGSSAPDRV